MPTPDFRKALSLFGRTVQERTPVTDARQAAFEVVNRILDAASPPLTPDTRLAVVGLAGSLANNLQDYAEDALRLVTQGTPQQVWAALPEPVRETLDRCWPEEGGLTFVGKIGIAVVSEGFVFT